MADQRAKDERFKALTAIDLQEWAGTTIFYRGQEYQRNRRVQGLARTPGGAVVAWIMGSQRYATSVDLVEGRLISSCSCPYGMTCKHAVALALEYIEQLKKRSSVPTVSGQDQRLAVIDAAESDEWDGSEDEWEDEDEDWDEMTLASLPSRLEQRKGPCAPFLSSSRRPGWSSCWRSWPGATRRCAMPWSTGATWRAAGCPS